MNDDARDSEDRTTPNRTRRPLKLDLDERYRQVPVDTENLGTVYVRRPTVTMASALLERLKDQSQDDSVVARIFMGCASGKQPKGKETVTEPLSVDDADRLTDSDVLRLADAYLNDVLGIEKTSADPIPRVAEQARVELKEIQEGRERLAAAVGGSLRHMFETVDASAAVMRNWQDNFGKNAALKAITDFRERLQPQLGATLPKPLDIQSVQMPSIEKTPLGRTMHAAEASVAAVGRIESSMNLIVNQAGNVSALISELGKQIERESRAMQARTEKQTQKALSYAKWSLAIAAMALVVSAVSMVANTLNGDREAKSAAIARDALLAQEHLQNVQLGKLVDATMLSAKEKAPALEKTPPKKQTDSTRR